jgi:hypothetical protein
VIEPYDDTISHNRSICTKPYANIRFEGPACYEVLLTCRDVYNEARLVLAANLSICFGIRAAETFKHFWRSKCRHSFLDFAIPHIRKVSSTLFDRGHARQLASFFHSVRCIKFGPDIARASDRNVLRLFRKDIESGKHDAEVWDWIKRELPRWKDKSDLEDAACINSAQERITFTSMLAGA